MRGDLFSFFSPHRYAGTWLSAMTAGQQERMSSPCTSFILSLNCTWENYRNGRKEKEGIDCARMGEEMTRGCRPEKKKRRGSEADIVCRNHVLCGQ
jgi:hypothetical protein